MTADQLGDAERQDLLERIRAEGPFAYLEHDSLSAYLSRRYGPPPTAPDNVLLIEMPLGLDPDKILIPTNKGNT